MFLSESLQRSQLLTQVTEEKSKGKRGGFYQESESVRWDEVQARELSRAQVCEEPCPQTPSVGSYKAIG